MARDYLLVDGIDSKIKDALKDEAFKRFGKANASLLVRTLIADCLQGSLFEERKNEYAIDLSGAMGRFELTLPQSCIDELDHRAEMRLSPRNYYICNLIFKELGKPQLLIDEVEILVNSNYEMARISSALKSISASYSAAMKNGSMGALPELSKALNKLKLDVDKHVSLIMNVLEVGTVIIETKGKGKGRGKAKFKTENSN